MDYRETGERFSDDEEWFGQEVEKGLAAAERGDFVEHDDVVRRIYDDSRR